MTPDEFLATEVKWWDGKKVTVNSLLAEVYIASRGLGGKAAFDGQTPPGAVVQLPPLAGLPGIKTQTERIDEIEARLTGVDTRVQAIHTTVNAILAKLNEA